MDTVVAAPPIGVPMSLLFAAIAVVAYTVAMRNVTFTAPILLILDPFDLTRYVGHTTVTTFKAGLVGICVALARRGAFAWPTGRLERWILLALGAVALATALTIPEATLRSAALRETLKAIEYALVFFVALSAARADAEAPRVFGLAAAVAIFAVAVGSVRDFFRPQSGVWIAGHAYLRLAGDLEGPNQLAAWLGILLPAVAATASPILPAALAVGGVILALTLSRGGIAQALTALALVGIAQGRRAWRPVILAVVTFALALAGFAAVSRSSATASHIASIASSFDAGGTGSREILWRAAEAMFRAHPVLGVGAGNFEFLLHAYGAPPRVQTQANSLYLEALADGGIVLGLTTIVAAWLPPLLLLRSRPRSFAFAAGVAGCALAAHGLIDDVTFYTKVGQCWWLFAGVAAGSVTGVNSPTRDSPDGFRIAPG